MARLLTTFLIVLGLLPATASAAAPTCPDDNADEFGGSGEVFGVAGVPQRAQSAGAIVVRDGNHTPRCRPRAGAERAEVELRVLSVSANSRARPGPDGVPAGFSSSGRRFR
jgi:hypothetical protein